MPVIDLIDRWLGVCARVFHVLANACLAVLLLINVANISLRAIFDKGILWVFPWSVVIFVWMTFFGFFVLYRLRRDITIDFIHDRLGPAWQLTLRLFVNFVIVALMSVMLWHAPEIIARQVGEIEMVLLFGHQVQRYVMSIPLFISCALILLNYVVDTAYAVAGRDAPHHPSSGHA